jgi:hypothetical protein
MSQTPEYTVRLRTPHEHQREKETPEPLTSAKAPGRGKMLEDYGRTWEARWPGICLRSGTDSE